MPTSVAAVSVTVGTLDTDDRTQVVRFAVPVLVVVVVPAVHVVVPPDVVEHVPYVAAETIAVVSPTLPVAPAVVVRPMHR